MKVYAIAFNTFREAIRNKILFAVLGFVVLMIAISAFFGTVSIGRQDKVIKDFGLFALSFFGAISAILCGISLLNNELKKKTVYNILSKPVSRSQFIVGKFFGLTLTVNVLLSVMSLGLIAFCWFIEGRVDWLLFQAVAFVMLESTIICAVTVFFSSLVVTTTLTGLFTFGFYLGGRSINYLNFFIGNEAGQSPVLKNFIRFFDIILPDLSLMNVGNIVVHGEAIAGTHFIHGILYCLCYSMIAVSLASVIFQKRDLV